VINVRVIERVHSDELRTTTANSVPCTGSFWFSVVSSITSMHHSLRNASLGPSAVQTSVTYRATIAWTSLSALISQWPLRDTIRQLMTIYQWWAGEGGGGNGARQRCNFVFFFLFVCFLCFSAHREQGVSLLYYSASCSFQKCFRCMNYMVQFPKETQAKPHTSRQLMKSRYSSVLSSVRNAFFSNCVR
jgi:hypothetical protein